MLLVRLPSFLQDERSGLHCLSPRIAQETRQTCQASLDRFPRFKREMPKMSEAWRSYVRCLRQLWIDVENDILSHRHPILSLIKTCLLPLSFSSFAFAYFTSQTPASLLRLNNPDPRLQKEKISILRCNPLLTAG